MNILVNNKSQIVEESTLLDGLVRQLNIEVKGVAMAVNQTVISKVDWSQTELKENDNITIIKATQGG